MCSAFIVTEHNIKAEQGRIITIESVSCLHSVNGTIWYNTPIMIVRSEHHYMVAIVTIQYIADMVHYVLHAINDAISVTSTYTFWQLESTRTCFPSDRCGKWHFVVHYWCFRMVEQNKFSKTRRKRLMALNMMMGFKYVIMGFECDDGMVRENS